MNYFEHFLVFVSGISGCVLISVFDSVIGVSVDNASFGIGLKFVESLQQLKSNQWSAISKSQQSVINNKRKKLCNIVLLAKPKLNTIEVLVSMSLINPYINHDKFALVNNLLREYNKMQEEIKIPENATQYTI